MTSEEPKQAKIYNIETGRRGQEKIEREGSVPIEVLIKRLDRCARLEGLEKGFYSSDSEIKDVLEKSGFKAKGIESLNVSLLEQLLLYLQHKYTDYIFEGYSKENLMDILHERMNVTQKIMQNRLTDEEERERQALEKKSTEMTESGLTKEDHNRLIELRYLASSTLSINEIKEMMKLGNKSETLGGENKLLPEEEARLIELRRRAKESNPFKWLLDWAKAESEKAVELKNKTLGAMYSTLIEGGLTAKEAIELVELESKSNKPMTDNEQFRISELRKKYKEVLPEKMEEIIANTSLYERRYLEYKISGLTGMEAIDRADLEARADAVGYEGLTHNERIKLDKLREKTKI